jgi:hypothetical protein
MILELLMLLNVITWVAITLTDFAIVVGTFARMLKHVLTHVFTD